MQLHHQVTVTATTAAAAGVLQLLSSLTLSLLMVMTMMSSSSSIVGVDAFSTTISLDQQQRRQQILTTAATSRGVSGGGRVFSSSSSSSTTTSVAVFSRRRNNNNKSRGAWRRNARGHQHQCFPRTTTASSSTITSSSSSSLAATSSSPSFAPGGPEGRLVGADLEVSFGSEQNNVEEQQDDGDDYDEINGGIEQRYNEYADDDRDYLQRQQRVREIVEESEIEAKQERKRVMWGQFANVTGADELESVAEQVSAQIQKEHQIKAQNAERSGISYTVLEAPEETTAGGGVGIWEDTDGNNNNENNIQIKAGSNTPTSWFADIDADLEDEWDALVSSSSSQSSSSKDNDEENNNIENGEKSQELQQQQIISDVSVDEGSGKLISREAKAGVRVGSAAGWSLEAYPGDFLVHRKYGIGRFERTCLRPKSRLSAEEKTAQDERRAELLKEALEARASSKNGDAATGKKKSITTDEIQEIRAKFGTNEDKDPVSNPQTTVLEIAYDDAVVHVPVDRAYRLSRYRSANSAVKPRLSKVKGQAWSKAKQRVQENTLQIAQDVLALYATRELLQRQPYDPAMEPSMADFYETFPFTPTPDQVTCFEDVENDMVWKRRPMDRLVCGDVGFGKTEVALRALYRAVQNGKQAAFLAPTGVLASQHFKNVCRRMEPFNINIALLRGGMGKNTKAGKALRGDLANGNIQLVVGTHALLSNDNKFSDLGLLVVDEEQRFGVKQKERLKLISHGVDVLTLTATPIPRTLQMSLSGIRDTSTLRSPPPMRKPTVTLVQDFSEEMVYEAISTELNRGGQCYYVVPRIAMLDEAEELIKRLFPDIRIIMAHGRMRRNGAEENVAAFAEGRYDVLLATTVIENGVDIPSVNTIVVQNSQAFGMSTLYQLRGRVGRSDVQAYAYFLHKPEAVTEQAVLRLQAIGELQELGSGFDVANRDLEIRGAGSLLGTEQSGMAAKVGFDLYMRMLKKSIRQLRGLDLPAVPRTNILLPVTMDDGITDDSSSLRSDLFKISAEFIPNDEHRREEEAKARLAESTAALVQLTTLWKKKHGVLPADLQKHLKTMHLHACTRRLGIDLVGLVDSGQVDDKGRPIMDCVLRSPGFRPRHWGSIAPALPRGVKGLNAIFPPRFSPKGDEDMQITGGTKIDLKALLADQNLEDKEDQEWDAMDEEDMEAMKQISSAVEVKDMEDVDLEQYPRFVVKNFCSLTDAGKIAQKGTVDRLLKVLLPLSKAVYEKQEHEAEEAKLASELREKQEILRTRKKANQAAENKRLGYQY